MRYTDRDWLEHKYHVELLSTTEIADIVDENPGTIYYWMKKHDISTRGQGSGKRNSVTFTCDNDGCDTEVTRPESQVNDGYNYCSSSCVYEHKECFLSGEDHPNWRGGVGSTGYGESWISTRDEVRERDNHCCRKCGTASEDKDCYFDVHHITPFREFDTPEDAHTLDNLVLLCRPCHREVEGLSEEEQLTFFD